MKVRVNVPKFIPMIIFHLASYRYTLFFRAIPVTGTSVNPARSIGPALFEGGAALSQLWLFIVAPFVGAAFSAIVWKVIAAKEEK